MKECLNCSKETKNAKFCSLSCSASYNNAEREKKAFYCQSCNKQLGKGYVQFHRRKYCDDCNPQKVDWSAVTLGDVQSRRKYQINSQVRDMARSLAKGLPRFEQCANCGYSKHVEVCHVKAISSFTAETLMSDVNSMENIVGLCPNCHWEYDNSELQFSEDWVS